MNANVDTTVEKQEITVTVTRQQVRALFTGMGVLDHNTLSGLQGGNDTERYHLTKAELTTKWVKRSGDSMTGDLSMTTNDLLNIGKLSFDLTNTESPDEGEINWNADDGTPQVGMPGGVVKGQMFQEQFFRPRNTSGAVMPNGTVTSITGATGAVAEVDLATTTPPSTSGAIAMATESIDDNQRGYNTTFGLVRGIDTSAIDEGARVFLSDTPGEFTNTLPADTSRKVFLGIVNRSHATEGELLLFPINIFFFGELSGVVFTNLQVGDVPTWDGTKWINQAP